MREKVRDACQSAVATQVCNGPAHRCEVTLGRYCPTHSKSLHVSAQVLTDLLAPERPRLQLREDLRVGVYVEGLTEEPVASAADAVRALAAGMGRRQVGGALRPCPPLVWGDY